MTLLSGERAAWSVERRATTYIEEIYQHEYQAILALNTF